MTPAAPRHFRIFISSPGDVADERQIARQVVEQLPYNPFVRGKITTEVIAWDKPGGGAPLLATMTPQEAINVGLPKPSECDVVVVIFWSRMGTPLIGDLKKPDGSPYLSGTEWEYEDAVAAARQSGSPEVLVYRRSSDEFTLKPSDAEFMEKYEQWQRVEAFFARFVDPKTKAFVGGYNTYSKPDAFRDQFETHLDSIMRRLLERAEAQDAAGTPAPAASSSAEKRVVITGSPFPGLRAFTPKDQPIFFGRGRETDALLDMVRQHRFVAVIGASGSGKSSLVGAGLIPRLRAYGLTGSQDWVLPDWQAAAPQGEEQRGQWIGLRFTPGESGDGNPFSALAVKLLPMIGDQNQNVPKLAAELSSDAGAFTRLMTGYLGTKLDWAEALVFVDQFEELLITVKSDWRVPFVEMLAQAAASPRLRVVLTLRADFYQQAIAAEGRLGQLLENGSFPLSAPDLPALEKMITRPAALAGLEFEDDLAGRILADTGSDPGALPLLAYALDELYQRGKASGRLTYAAYNGPGGLGGIAGAIGNRAEETFNRLPKEVQSTLAPVFRTLVEVNEDGIAGRRRALLSTAAPNDSSRQLVDALTGASLLVRSRDSDNQPVVEVAHEALLEHWPRLKKVLDADRDYLRWRQHLSDDVNAWDSRQRNRSFLYSGLRLAEADNWEKRYPGELAKAVELAPTFLQASRRRRLAYQSAQWGTIAVVVLVALIVLIAQLVQSRSTQAAKDAASSPLIAFPASRALFGTDNHPEQVAAFSLDQHEVSISQYRLCVTAGACLRPLEPTGSDDFNSGDGNLPVAWVTAYQAFAFCQWIDRRLPTSQEWERAARGTDGRQFPWGMTTPAPSQVNLSVDIYPPFGLPSPAPVDSSNFASGDTPEGIAHMLGNVREWTETPATCDNNGTCSADDQTLWDGQQSATLVIRGLGRAADTLSASDWGEPLAQILPTQANISDIDLGFRCAAS